jgi:hypothetical protein
MPEDITVRLRDMLSWENADEAIMEIHTLRQMVRDWEHTARMLAIDLGNIEYAIEIYLDVSDGLYDHIRERIKSIE